MIFFIIVSFVILIIALTLLMSYEIRQKVIDFAQSLLPQGKKKLLNARKFAHEMNHAASADQIQTHWHLQQWWILIAGFFLLSSIMLFAFTKPVDPTKIEANYLKKADPQIYNLLNGEILSPPPEVEESLVDAAIVEAIRLEQQYQAQTGGSVSSTTTPNVENSEFSHGHLDTSMVNRKWDKMHPRYKQRLLMVFKIMKEQHGYELVLLEGYRSPARQNSLSRNKATTLATAYRSYHQFGLAADVAFKRDGKVVISERDPWAMRGYQLYGQVAESVGLVWEGRWTKIHDYGHTEYRMPGLVRSKETHDRFMREAEQGNLMASNIEQ